VRFTFKYYTITLSVLLFFLFVFTGFAQAPPEVTKLVVELWPEYDRPDVLVIYRVELSEDTPLPAPVTFNFPGYVDDLHAVAYKQDGKLLSVAPEDIDLQRSGDTLQLSFPSVSRELHFEYYDPQILNTQDKSRLLDYNFVADYNIADADFSVQEPSDSEDFTLNPQATNTFTGINGQLFQTVETADMSPGDIFGLTASYMRNADAPLVTPQPPQSQQPAPIQVITEDSSNIEIPSTSSALGYILIGGGILLLVGGAGYWWYSNKSSKTETQQGPPMAAKPAHRNKPPATSPVQKSSPAEDASAGYCYQCGTALRADADFCHVCGAERRK